MSKFNNVDHESTKYVTIFATKVDRCIAGDMSQQALWVRLPALLDCQGEKNPAFAGFVEDYWSIPA